MRKCKKVILESKGNFTIRKLIADEEGVRGLESWDLSVFSFPRPEKWKNTTVNEKVKTLELEFTGEKGVCRQTWSLQALLTALYREEPIP